MALGLQGLAFVLFQGFGNRSKGLLDFAVVLAELRLSRRGQLGLLRHIAEAASRTLSSGMGTGFLLAYFSPWLSRLVAIDLASATAT